MKKTLTIILALVLALGVLAGCGSSASTPSASEAPATEAPADASEAPAALTPLVVGASSTPHAEILESVKDVLAAEGYDLQVVVYDDYVLPNTALADGELDANYFQHTPYLNSFNASNGTDLVSAAKIHYEPFGIYGNGVSDLSELQPGATIIIPADDSNETRALLLLQQEGLIKLPDDASAEKGVNHLDIVDDGGYNVTPVQADTVPSVLANSDAGTIAVINGNYALDAGLKPTTNGLFVEAADSEFATLYANIVAVRPADLDSDWLKALHTALTSKEAYDYMITTYEGGVIPTFTVEDAE